MKKTLFTIATSLLIFSSEAESCLREARVEGFKEIISLKELTLDSMENFSIEEASSYLEKENNEELLYRVNFILRENGLQRISAVRVKLQETRDNACVVLDSEIIEAHR